MVFMEEHRLMMMQRCSGGWAGLDQNTEGCWRKTRAFVSK